MLNKYEKKLVSILELNPKITTRKFIELADIGKKTFYKYTKTLEDNDYISYEKIKNRKEWYLTKTQSNHRIAYDYDTIKRSLDDRFKEIKSKTTQAMEKGFSGDTNDKVIGFGDSILLILLSIAQSKLIYYYRKKHVPDEEIKFEKKIEKLLEKIVNNKKFPEHGYGRLAINQVIRETEDRLDEFLGIEKPTPKPI